MTSDTPITDDRLPVPQQGVWKKVYSEIDSPRMGRAREDLNDIEVVGKRVYGKKLRLKEVGI
mgnify:CR=1 FL=1